ncbi:MAG: Secretion system C-terminal sorting domain [Bacteroidetes bacterium]|jgi:hypothetical protein|nr:Secretion system C-terminal sorting domain [Bacteroidota bacterium]
MKKSVLAALACLFCNSFIAQQISPHVVNSCGTTFSNATAQLAFNVGETAVTSITNFSSTITQGFLQPENNGFSIKENKTTADFVMYPNPVNTELNIRSTNYKGTLQVKLLDGTGRTIYSGELKNNAVSMESFPNGIYQLLLLDTEQKIIDHKTITKIN